MTIEHLKACGGIDASLLSMANLLRRAKRQPASANKRQVVAKLRQLCAERCIALGLPENAADGTRRHLEEAIASIHPTREPRP